MHVFFLMHSAISQEKCIFHLLIFQEKCNAVQKDLFSDSHLSWIVFLRKNAIGYDNARKMYPKMNPQ